MLERVSGIWWGCLCSMWLVISKAQKMGADPVLTIGGWVCGVEKPNFCTACKLGCVCISGN